MRKVIPIIVLIVFAFCSIADANAQVKAKSKTRTHRTTAVKKLCPNHLKTVILQE